MTQSWQITVLGPLAFALLAALGCGAAPDLKPPPAAPAEAAEVEQTGEPEEEQPVEAPPADRPQTEEPAADNEAADPAADYTPPFPERIDLFVMPKRQGGGTTRGDHDESVELIGFARLDVQQALISFNGEVSPLAEGAELYGVQVISIRPPEVVLQRGRQRWQASLQN